MTKLRVNLVLYLGLTILMAACLEPSAQNLTAPVASVVPPHAPASVQSSVVSNEYSCTVITTEPTPAPAENSLLSPASEADFTLGAQDAPITLIEYCDFQAPVCRSMAAAISNLYHKYPNGLKFVFRPVPAVGSLDKSQLAVQAALAAQDQGKFWEMYDALFQKNTEWDGLTLKEFNTWLLNEAVALGLDEGRFADALNSDETVESALSLYESALASGVQSFPLLFINGRPQALFSIDYYSLDSTISLLLLGDRQFTECPPFIVGPSDQYISTIHTAKGDIVIELFADTAPLAVNSFIFLARQGWFDGVTFHRVIPGFMAQTGDPSGTGRGNPGYFFKNEASDLKFDKPGVVGIANSGPDTNGSQFFITFGPASHLDGGYTIFGQVIQGMDVIQQLTARDPSQRPDLPPGDLILSVDIEQN